MKIVVRSKMNRNRGRSLLGMVFIPAVLALFVVFGSARSEERPPHIDLPPASQPPPPLPEQPELRPGEPLIGEDQLMYRKAKGLFDTGKWDAARKELDGLIETHPQSVFVGKSYLLIGRIAERRAQKESGLGREARNRLYRSAIRLYWKAHLAPPDGWDQGESFYRMGRLMLTRMHFDPEAKGYLNLGIIESPDGPYSYESRVLIAEILRREGHLEKSRQVIDHVEGRVRLEPNLPTTRLLPVLYEKARIALEQNDLPDVGRILSEALSADGTYPYSHPSLFFLLGRYAERVGHTRRAFSLFRNFVRFDPASPDVPEAGYRMAILAGRMGRSRSMRGRLVELYHDYPDTDWGIRARLKILEERDEKPLEIAVPTPPHQKSVLDRRVEELERIDIKDGSQTTKVIALSLMVPLLAHREQWTVALRKLHRLSIGTDPLSRPGLRLANLEKSLVYGWILKESGAGHDGAVREIARDYGYALFPALTDPDPVPFESLEIPKAALVLDRIGRAEQKKGRFVEAGRWFRKALGVASLNDKPEVLGDLFDLSLASKDPLEAYRTGENLLAVLPADPVERPAWLGRMAGLAKRLGMPGSEEGYLEERLREFPEDPTSGRSAYRIFGIERELGHFRRARAMALRSRAFLDDSGNPADRKALGDLLYDWGQMEHEIHHPGAAYRAWSDFVKFAPEDSRAGWAQYQLGKIAETMGRSDDAYRWFRRASLAKEPSPLSDVARQKADAIKLRQEAQNRGL